MKDENQDVLTQFSYACKLLGIRIESTSVCQAEGVIERANWTFQDRLRNELALEGISSIDLANRHPAAIFIPSHNRRFAGSLTGFLPFLRTRHRRRRINIITMISPRKFDNGSSINYFGHYCQTVDEDGRLVCFKKKTVCIVICAFDGRYSLLRMTTSLLWPRSPRPNFLLLSLILRLFP